MTTSDKLVEPDLISCVVCLKEIPLSEATTPEATDYFVHFCGLQCYEEWKGQGKEAKESSEKAGS